jgi:hypothetical protein
MDSSNNKSFDPTEYIEPIRSISDGRREGVFLVRDKRIDELRVVKSFILPKPSEPGKEGKANARHQDVEKERNYITADISLYSRLPTKAKNLVYVTETLHKFPRYCDISFVIAPFCKAGSLKEVLQYADATGQIVSEWFIWHCINGMFVGLNSLKEAGISGHNDLHCGNLFLDFENIPSNGQIGDQLPKIYLGDFHGCEGDAQGLFEEDLQKFILSLNRCCFVVRRLDTLDFQTTFSPDYSDSLQWFFYLTYTQPKEYVKHLDHSIKFVEDEIKKLGDVKMPDWMIEYFQQVVDGSSKPCYKSIAQMARIATAHGIQRPKSV